MAVVFVQMVTNSVCLYSLYQTQNMCSVYVFLCVDGYQAITGEHAELDVDMCYSYVMYVQTCALGVL
jgi:hypothetical protein